MLTNLYLIAKMRVQLKLSLLPLRFYFFRVLLAERLAVLITKLK